MAHGGLKSVRETFILAYFDDVIDEIEFSALYESNFSKEVFPYWKFSKFKFDNWENSECNIDLRFGKPDVQHLLEVLNFLGSLFVPREQFCSGLEGLCILLKRLAFPCRYTDMVSRFGRNPTELCLIFNHVLDFVYDNQNHRLVSWDQQFLQPQMLERYAQAIYNKGSPLQNCFGFIDGTLCRVARPKRNQHVVFNGHKRVHTVKFQSVVFPNGLIGNLHGPFEGRRHDSTMLHESGLLADLERFAWVNGKPFCLYGDPAYPLLLEMPTLPHRWRSSTSA